MHLTRHPCWCSLATQKPLGFAEDNIGTGIVFGRLYSRLLVRTGGAAALRPTLEVHTHFARLLLESQ